MTKADFTEILDAARTTGEYDRLTRVLFVHAPQATVDKADIVQEALVEIHKMLDAGEPSFLIAPQLKGILSTCAKRLVASKQRFDGRLGDTGDEVFDIVAPDCDDPAVFYARLEDFDEKIAELKKLRESNPRYFEAAVADFQEIPIPEHIKEQLGETITSANAWKLRERSQQKLSKNLEQSRKESSS